MKKLFYILILLFPLLGYSQNSASDSLILALTKHKADDTTKVVLLNKLAWELKYNNPDTAVLLAKNALLISKLVAWDYGIGRSLHSMGSYYYIKGDVSNSMASFNKALDVWDEMAKQTKGEDRKKILIKKNATIANMGIVYWSNADYSKALELYQQAFKTSKELNDIEGQAKVMANIGLIYLDQDDYKKAEDYLLKSLQIDLKLNNIHGISIVYSNLGIVYRNMGSKIRTDCNCDNDSGNFQKALEYHRKALEIATELNDKGRIESSIGNIGIIYADLENYNQSLSHYAEAVKISKEIGDKNGESIWLGNIGNSYLDLKQYKLAEENFLEALKLSQEIDARNITLSNYKHLVNLYDSLNKIKPTIHSLKNGYEFFKKYEALNDSIFSEEQIQKQTRLEEQFKFEQIQQKERLVNAEKLAKIEAEEERQRVYTISSIIVAILILLFLVIIFKRLKVSNYQKKIIEEKNKEITDSITYAKRIQGAILPPDRMVREHLPESFILYKPKDIVAGDFYWMEAVGNKVMFAACDCTGHGVPGAMVSVVCNNGLNRSVREHQLTDPGKILDKTREIVVQEFEKSEEDVKDGMDIALCSLEGNTLEYAGAHNPLWIIRNNTNEIEEIKADKQPIGKTDNPQPYTTYKVELQKGDTIYIFSDGYADQFGGEQGKKMKTTNFKKLLLSIKNETMKQQKELIDETFESWKGNLEQLDDVCVIGVRV